jgi:hypothetical protein
MDRAFGQNPHDDSGRERAAALILFFDNLDPQAGSDFTSFGESHGAIVLIFLSTKNTKPAPVGVGRGKNLKVRKEEHGSIVDRLT